MSFLESTPRRCLACRKFPKTLKVLVWVLAIFSFWISLVVGLGLAAYGHLFWVYLWLMRH